MLQRCRLLLALASGAAAAGALEGGGPDFSGVEVITFDFYAALMNTTGSLKLNGREILARDPATARWTPTQADGFVAAWVTQYSAYVGVANALQRNAGLHWAEADLWKVMLHTTLNYTCASQKVALSASTREALAQSWKRLKPWPNTLAVLQALRSTGRFKLALLSNGDAEWLHTAAAAALPPMDGEFGCEHLGVGGVALFKPEPELYQQVRSLLPEEPEDQWKQKVLHVAGAPYDASGSKAFGFHTAWNSMKADPAFLDYTGAGLVPDVILHDIGELPRFLGIEADVGEFPSAVELGSEPPAHVIYA